MPSKSWSWRTAPRRLVIRGVNGTSPVAHASGATLTPSRGRRGYPLSAPTGFLAESMVRAECPEVNTVIGTTGQIAMQAIWLRAGMTVTNLTLLCDNRRRHADALLLRAVHPRRRSLRQHCDQTTTAWAANTVKTLASRPLRGPDLRPVLHRRHGRCHYRPNPQGGTAKTDGTLQNTALLSPESQGRRTPPERLQPLSRRSGAVTTSFYAAVSSMKPAGKAGDPRPPQSPAAQRPPPRSDAHQVHPENIGAIIKALEGGNTMEDSCRAVGSTTPRCAIGSPLSDFAESVEKASAQAHQAMSMWCAPSPSLATGKPP